jgi:PHP family Zn ribbon phosphoesterase
MTMQRRTTIEPHDIVALKLECEECRARYSVPIEEIKKAQMNCPNCGVQWLRGLETNGGGPETGPLRVS